MAEKQKVYSAEELGLTPSKPAEPQKQQTFSAEELGLEPSPSQPAEGQSLETGMLSTLKSLGRGVAAVGRKVDSFTGAPARAAIGAMQDGKSPLAAFAGQFGEDPESAPTGKEIAAKAGLSTEDSIKLPLVGLTGERLKVSPAGMAGLGVDVFADPTIFIPAGAISKVAGLGAKATGKGLQVGAKMVDVGTGLPATKALNFAKGQKEAAKLALEKFFSPKMADDFPELYRIAERNGIQPNLLPESVEFGEGSIISRASRVKAEGILGEAQLRKHQAGLEQTRKATQGLVADIAGGRIFTPQEAGGIIRDAYDDAVSRVMQSSTDTYRSIAKGNPGMRLSPEDTEKLAAKLDELGNYAESRLKLGFSSAQKSQAKQLQEAVDSLKGAISEGWETGGEVVLAQPLFDDIIQRHQILGEVAFRKKGLLDIDPPDVKRLQDLYFEMRDAIVGTVEKELGDGVAESLKKSNAQIAEFLSDREPLTRALGNRSLADENLYKTLVQNGDSKKLEALKKIMTPEQLQQIKGTLLNDLIKPDMNDEFTFGRITNSIRAKQGILEDLLDPEEIKEFTDLVRLGDRFGSPIMSSSGTGASNAIREGLNLKGKIADAVISESFIESLKNRARKGSPQMMQLSDGSSVPMPPGMSLNAPAQGLNSTIRSFIPSKTGARLKASQVYSVSAPTDDNETRREAIRRRLQRGE
jgi:hypothetical protein